jgi:pyruvate/2-oxoglutarate dehydrogenase complex dihydrolipoamide dehydrogenase (E3) component
VNNVDVFIGDGVFTGPNTVQVGGQTLKFTHACIATGARPAVPPIKGLKTVKYLTNETIFNLTELPKRLCVIGAGAVGCELAQAFARFGSKVTICSRSDTLLAREDPEAVAIIEEAFKKDGVGSYPPFTACRCVRNG